MRPIYQSNPAKAPDSEFEPGTLEHLVPGNTGRVLDPRRTPVRVIRVLPDTGFVVLEITDFEDRGATWEVPFESIGHYQFARGSRRASPDEVAAFSQAVRRFDRPLRIAADPAARARTEDRLRVFVEEAADWRRSHGPFLGLRAALDRPGLEGPAPLRQEFDAYMRRHGLGEMETAFSARYVRNPCSGEMVKGHRIVVAELGLVSFEGKVVRDADLMGGDWSRAARAEHVLRRLAFLRALFAEAGVARVMLFRGFSCRGAPRPPSNETFVSATFHQDVALSHFRNRQEEGAGVLLRQPVPAERLFMTYLETGAMNAMYKEAEAVLLFEEGNPLF